MIESPPVHTVLLENGITLRFRDNSNRYYGDFHRVLVVVEGSFEINARCLSDELKRELTNFRDSMLYRRELERMGVTSDRLERTVCELIDSFLASAKGYLERPEVPEQLMKKRLAEKGKRRQSSLKGKL